MAGGRFPEGALPHVRAAPPTPLVFPLRQREEIQRHVALILSIFVESKFPNASNASNASNDMLSAVHCGKLQENNGTPAPVHASEAVSHELSRQSLVDLNGSFMLGLSKCA